MNGPLLAVDNLSKTYGGRRPLEAVKGISFEIQPGECFGLLGPNGAGKSTAIQCITGFYPASQGEVRIAGLGVREKPREARRLLGYCPQDDTLDTDFLVKDQLVRHGTYFGLPYKEADERATRLLEQFGLEDKANEMVESLSGGMRRRLQVARSLVANPRLLVLDEPTTGLDPDARRSLWDVLVQARGAGVAILLSTHYMDEAERLCDRIAIMNRGRIFDIAPPEMLIQRHITESSIREEVRPGVVWNRPPNLEDVFLKLSGTRLHKEVP